MDSDTSSSGRGAGMGEALTPQRINRRARKVTRREIKNETSIVVVNGGRGGLCVVCKSNGK